MTSTNTTRAHGFSPNKITVWKRGGERAPHKPLLALYAIGRLLRGEPRMVAYADVDRDLSKLLMEFGPRRQSYHPEGPFWRLQNDELWELERRRAHDATRRGDTDAKKSELLTIIRFRVRFSWAGKKTGPCTSLRHWMNLCQKFSWSRHMSRIWNTSNLTTKPGGKNEPE
ncbi:MAG TPA: hypothetical protein VGA09_14815 [Candidatus Binatia bacterium]